MKNCVNCHFLTKETPRGDGQSLCFSLRESDREEIVSEPNSLPSYYLLKCAKGVWDEGVDQNLKSQRKSIIYKTNRKNFCFHFPVHEGMLFQAASELQKRQEEFEKYNNNNKYTRIGLYIAAIGLLANAIVALLTK